VKTIVEIKFGSHLYGTSTPASDIDYKTVFVPDGDAILLQRIKATVTNKRPKQPFEKNVAGEIDQEAYALHRYLQLLAEGQTVALDMLFAPRWAMPSPPDPIWDFVWDCRHRLLSRRAASFIGYCRTQANKYGIKGSRVHAVRNVVEWFDQAIGIYGHLAKLSDAAADLPTFIAERKLEHTTVLPIEHPSRPGHPIMHLECCARKAPFTVSLKDTRAIFARLLDEYGARALMAERSEGVDWKALSHAVRVGEEALELLATGHITFPLPNAVHILEIKKGELPYKAVAEEIEDLLERVEAAEKVSALPETPDQSVIDAIVRDAYRSAVARA
jgi:hypothetical protein